TTQSRVSSGRFSFSQANPRRPGVYAESGFLAISPSLSRARASAKRASTWAAPVGRSRGGEGGVAGGGGGGGLGGGDGEAAAEAQLLEPLATLTERGVEQPVAPL